MARQYSPKNFLRQAPNALLARYFQEKHVLTEVDFTALSETNIGPIYEAWDDLPSETRRSIESDFRNIDDLACENGVKALIDAAQEEGEDLEPIFAEMDGFYDKAFWSFFEKESFFELSLLFVKADNLPTRYWRRRKDLPKVPALKDEASLRELGETFSYYFRTTEGRGHDCAIDYYHRNDLDYFFAYPEDYARTSIEWNQGALERRAHKPAFEVIAVYSMARAPWTFSSMGASRPCATCR